MFWPRDVAIVKFEYIVSTMKIYLIYDIANETELTRQEVLIG